MLTPHHSYCEASSTGNTCCILLSFTSLRLGKNFITDQPGQQVHRLDGGASGLALP